MERKRGKLENLNRFLSGGVTTGINVKVGSKEDLAHIKYVITLDADTQLPRGTARELIETLSHPLNVPYVSNSGTVKRGYGIIQPRLSTDFAQSKLSLFSRIF